MQYPSLQKLGWASVPEEYSSTWPDHSTWRAWQEAGSRFLYLDDFSRYKVVAFMTKTSDATAVLRAITAKYFTPAGLNIGVIRTDNGGEFQGAFQSLLPELGIRHERTLPYMPQ